MFGPVPLKKCKIVPRFELPDLVKLKRIQYPCEMMLNSHEILRAIHYADVYEILEEGQKVLLHQGNYDKVNTILDADPNIKDIVDVKGIEEELWTYQIVGLNTGGVGHMRILS